MKLLFPSLLALAAGATLLATPAQAQTIPNSSFENWSIRTRSVVGGVEAPDNWLTDDDFYAWYNSSQSYGGSGDPEAQVASSRRVVRTNVARGGSSAVQLQTGSSGSGYEGAYLSLGDIFIGNPDPTNLFNDIENHTHTYETYVPSGLMTTARPAAMQFYYQLFAAPSAVRVDSSFKASIEVKLTRQVGTRTEIIARGVQYITRRARAYTLFNVPLRYLSKATPDKLQITFVLSNNLAKGPNPFTGNIWRIDDISFTGGTVRSAATASADPAQPAATLATTLSVFPNPSADGRYELSAAEPALLAVPLAVLDAYGQVVRREDAPRSAPADSRTLDLSGLPRGLYTVQFFTASGLVTRRLSRQ